jgi:small subunit ribosomal protein S4e
MHLKRQKTPKNWPIKRKGSIFVVRPTQGIKKSIPLLVVIRDILFLAKNRKEVKKIIRDKKLLLNNKIIKKDNESLFLFDILKIVPSNESYKVKINEKGKFELIKINKKEEETKVLKIINKKILKGKKEQLNLNDGRNFLSNIKCKTNDSIIFNFNSNKIERCLEFKVGAKILIFSGKHSGKEGIIENINLNKKTVEIKIEKNNITVLIKQVMVIE